MNKITTTFTALLLSFCMQSVQGASKAWVDVTDKYIVNPRFDNNDIRTGWQGTEFGSYNPRENAEHYQKDFDSYQILSGLEPGKYRLSLNAFYRMGQANDDYNAYSSGNYSDRQHAKLYATSSINDYEVGIAPSSSAALAESLGGDASSVGNWWNRLFIPNNMEAADLWFSAGYYVNKLECEVGEDGNLRIGVRKFTTLNGDWMCIDNWKLEVYTDIKLIESITFGREQIEMVIGEKLTIIPIITPADATIQKVTWKSSNTKVLTVDANGELTAVSKGSANLSAVATDGSLKYGTIKVIVADNAPSSENIIINEIMAQNIDVYLDPNQNYGSWVELYNPTDRSVNLEGLYVSDDKENLKKNKLVKDYGTLTAHGYAILNFDHHEVWTKMSYRQIDDKLDPDGGTIYISDGTTIFAELDYPASIGRTSYARTTDGGNTWGYAGNPTPGTSNADCMFANERLDAPVVDKDAQLFNGSMQICVSFPEGATLKYTTNGTTPTLNNGEVSETGIFSIDETTTFRFRLFKDGFLPSTVVTRSYITDDGNNPFPIISIVTDPDNIYSSNRGAFKQGAYGRPGNGRDDNCNWNMDWDHPVNFEFITTDNECMVSQECSFSMCGGWSRAWEPHSFKLKANKIYDFQNAFNYDFFPDEKPGLKQKTLQIRNGGNDNNCRIIDGAIQGIITQNSKFYIDYQAWQPVRVFINGSYYAVLNMREPNNKHNAYANYGIDTDEMDQFEMSPDSGYVQMEGTKESFNEWYNLSYKADTEESYEKIKQLVDLDEYINYMAVELYAGGTDWPQNNVKGFRDRNNGKFHFVIFDLDFALGTNDPFQTFFDKQNYTFDNLRGYDYSRNVSINGQKKSQEIQFVTIFKNMLKNDDFRKRFIDAYSIVNGSLFTPERVQEIVNYRASHLAEGGYVNPWSSANKLTNSYNAERQAQMMNLLLGRSEMKLKSTMQFTANLSSNISEGEILINDQPLPTGKINGTLFTPVTIKATAPAGYKFKGWRYANNTNKVPSIIFEASTSWKYYDKGSLDNKNWKSSDFDDSSWQTGAAPLGYGKSQATTTQSQRPTYYFRKDFTLNEEPKTTDEFELSFNVDDGWVIYINGVEAGRHNMPSGNISYNTYSSTYADGQYDNGTTTFKSSLFKKGKNVIAVEVHNNNNTSSDILWSAEFTKYGLSATNTTYAYTDSVIHINSPKNISYIAEWEEMSEEEMIAEGLNTAPVIINEVSASNSVYVNDYFKKNDWMELYNNSSDDVDIAGLYISDNLAKPTKYKVPEDDVALNTVIPAHGYKVIWCDKLDNISDVIHTSFKLAAGEGDLMIMKRDAEGEIIFADTIKYIEHLGQQSFGRYPDAGVSTYVMDKPTPGKANIYTTYAVEYVAPKPEPQPNSIAIVRDGGMTIAYVDGVVNVKSEDYTIKSVEVFNASGAKVAGNITRNSGSFASLSVGALRTGIYVATATNANGDECKIKFVVK